MKKQCKICGFKEPNLLIKIKKDYICMSCFSKTKPVKSELMQIIEESVMENLVYIDSMYKKYLRKEE